MFNQDESSAVFFHYNINSVFYPLSAPPIGNKKQVYFLYIIY